MTLKDFPIEENDVVRLTDESIYGEIDLPTEKEGTVIWKSDDGKAFMVEFVMGDGTTHEQGIDRIYSEDELELTWKCPKQ